MILNNPACRFLSEGSKDGQFALRHPQDLTPIVFLLCEKDGYTWRGKNQELPRSTIFVGTATVFCPNDGMGRYPLGIFLSKHEIGLSSHLDAIIVRWEHDQELFGPHYVVFHEHHLVAWFVKEEKERRETRLEL